MKGLTHGQKKRYRSELTESPAFADAAASISVSTFGARRLPEIRGLCAAVGQHRPRRQKSIVDEEYRSRGGKSSSRHLRRRATSHLPRRRHRYPSATPVHNNSTHSSSRRTRRKKTDLPRKHLTWQEESRYDITECGVHWLTTHLWHAKRFHMKTLWGWKVPIAHTNRGPRASLRLANHQALLQDVTWKTQTISVSCFELEPLLTALRRICPNLLHDGPSVLSGNTIGEGVLHEPDQFPLGAIGPASWWVTASAVGGKMKWTLRFWAHPSIISKMGDAFTTVSSTIGNCEVEGPQRLPLARLQIRGLNATIAISHALTPVADDTVVMDSFCYNWDVLKKDSMHDRLAHGTVLHVHVQTNTRSNGVVKSQGSTYKGYVEDVRNRISGFNPKVDIPHNWALDSNKVALVRHCPCDELNVRQNAGVSGWDIVCRPTIAKELFFALIGDGGATVVGLVDEVAARSESEPPLPVFPRDFPDTEEGRRYWTDESSDWNMVRQYVEKGSGKQCKPKKLTTAAVIAWQKINGSFVPNTATGEENQRPTAERPGPVVVVRGDFGSPFQKALLTSARDPTVDRVDDILSLSTRRPRRPVRACDDNMETAPLTCHEASEHHNWCKMLLESLSLPAFIICDVILEDRGSISPGDCIYTRSSPLDDDAAASPLGVSVGGGFSTAYGRGHGIGCIEAASLLRLFCEKRGHRATVLVCRSGQGIPGSGGRRSVELKVAIDRKGQKKFPERLASVSFLL